MKTGFHLWRQLWSLPCPCPAGRRPSWRPGNWDRPSPLSLRTSRGDDSRPAPSSPATFHHGKLPSRLLDQRGVNVIHRFHDLVLIHDKAPPFSDSPSISSASGTAPILSGGTLEEVSGVTISRDIRYFSIDELSQQIMELDQGFTEPAAKTFSSWEEMEDFVLPLRRE